MRIQIPMPADPRPRIHLMQHPQHLPEHLLLCRCAIVLIDPPCRARGAPPPYQGGLGWVFPMSSLIAHPYRVLIIPLHMAPPHAQRPAVVERPITPHI